MDSTYDKEAHKIFKEVSLDPTLQKQYDNLNAIWKHPDDQQTGQLGGTVYVGNYKAASHLSTLVEYNIVAIINCQDQFSKNYFENNEKINYKRFVVSELAFKCRSNYSDHDNVTTPLDGGFQDVFDFIQQHIERGESVLIHCLAGAHRAGAVGTAWLMYKTGKGVSDALRLAKRCRPIISPFGHLLELLQQLESQLASQIDRM